MVKKKRKSVSHFPIFLDIEEKGCVVVGGGGVASRKVKALLESGADVIVISPSIHPGLEQLAKKKMLRLIRRKYKPGDLKGAVLVIAATDRNEMNREVALEAKRERIPVNVVDDPELSDFIVPSILRRGELAVAISTGGMSPALSKRVRMRLEENFGKEYAMLVSLVEEVRSSLKRQGIAVNAKAWQEALDLDFLINLLQKGQREKARTFLLKKLRA